MRLLIFLLTVLSPACDSSSLAFCITYSVYKLNKQGDNMQPWCTPFTIFQSMTVGCHHRVNGHEFEQTPGDSEGQGNLACYSPLGPKESDVTEWLTDKQSLMGLLSLKEEEIRTQHMRKEGHTKTQEENGHLQAKQRFQKNPSLPTTSWFHISSLQNCGEIHFCHLSYPVCSTLL